VLTLPEDWNSWLPKHQVFFEKFYMNKVKKSQLNLIMLCSLFYLLMKICWCKPWFGSTWSISEQFGLVWFGPVQHFICEFKTTSHISASYLKKEPHLARLSNVVLLLVLLLHSFTWHQLLACSYQINYAMHQGCLVACSHTVNPSNCEVLVLHSQLLWGFSYKSMCYNTFTISTFLTRSVIN